MLSVILLLVVMQFLLWQILSFVAVSVHGDNETVGNVRQIWPSSFSGMLPAIK